MLNINIEALDKKEFIHYIFEKSRRVAFRESECESSVLSWFCADIKKLFDEMQPFLVQEYEDTKYFYSDYQEINRIRVYDLNDNLLNYMISHKNTEVWGNIGFPEDPCFIDKCGQAVFTTIIHEEMCEFFGETSETISFLQEINVSFDVSETPNAIPCLERDVSESKKRTDDRRHEQEQIEQGKKEILKELDVMLKKNGFRFSQGYFYRFVKDEGLIYITTDGQDIFYDIIPLFAKFYEEEEILWPSFCTELYREEEGVQDQSCKEIFLNDILPKLVSVEDLTSLYHIRSYLYESHLGESIEDDLCLPYILLKLNRGEEAVSQIEHLYRATVEGLMDDDEWEDLYSETYDQAESYAKKELSMLLTLEALVKERNYDEVRQILNQNKSNAMKIILRTGLFTDTNH